MDQAIEEQNRILDQVLNWNTNQYSPQTQEQDIDCQVIQLLQNHYRIYKEINRKQEILDKKKFEIETNFRDLNSTSYVLEKCKEQKTKNWPSGEMLKLKNLKENPELIKKFEDEMQIEKIKDLESEIKLFFNEKRQVL